MSGTGTEINRVAQDKDYLRALVALRDRLTGEQETAKGAQAAALNIAIRALVSAIDILPIRLSRTSKGFHRK